MGVQIFFLLGFFSVTLAHNFGIFSHFEIWKKDMECQTNFEKLVEGLRKNEIWAFKILDASTKIPSGLLTGHFTDYGNYDECLSPGAPFDTKYCLATILPPLEWMNQILPNNSLALRWSYCIPASCPEIVLQNAVEKLLKDVKFNVSVSPSDCRTKEPKIIRTGDYFGISVWGIFVGLSVLSTIYDVIMDKTEAKNKWLSSFSLYTNGRNLLKTEVSPETMLPLNGLRFLSICWVVFGHRYFFTATSSLLNLADFGKELKNIRSQFFIQGVLAVDTFLLLSGLLNCYHLLMVLKKLKRFPVLAFYIHRYIRHPPENSSDPKVFFSMLLVLRWLLYENQLFESLTPVLAAIVLMYATWFPLIGDGPVWEQTTSVWKQLCVDNWAPTLLYINNYYNPISQCAGQSWYLAVDMQLYWLSPLIIIPLWKRPQFGKPLLWILLILSTVPPFVIAFVYKFRMSFTFGLNQEEMERVTKLIYVPTHTRATPYLIGVMIGYYLYNLKKTNTRLVMSKGVLLTGWLLSSLMALSVIFGNFQFTRPLSDHPYNALESSVYIACHRLGWGVAVGWLIVVCLNKQGGIINAILSWRAFIPLSRLTYCIFLSHMAIQQYQLGTARTSDYFQYFNQVHRYFGDLFFSLLAALGLSLIFESPILVLEKLTGRKPQERNLKSEVNNGFQDDSNATDKTHEI